MLLLLALVACREPVPTEDPASDPCEPVAAPGGTAAPLSDASTWESTETGYGTGLGWGDVNGDGQRDLVLASGNDMAPGPITVHHGHDGGLGATPDTTSAGLAYHGHLAIGDVDGDGYDDVAVARYLGLDGFGDPGGVDLYLGGAAGLEPDPAWSVDGFHTFSVALGDVDGDADLDLAVAVGELYAAEPGPDLLFRNEGGAFEDEPSWQSDAIAHSFDVAFLDADVDGDLDLAFARSGAPHALYLAEDGLSAEAAWEAPGDAFDGNRLVVGDVDADGLSDLLVSENTYGDGPGTLRLFCGAALDLCWESETDARPWSAASLVDLDGDADLDVVAGSWWGPVAWFVNRDGAIETLPAWESAETIVAEGFAWHDLDGAHEEEACLTGTGLVALPPGARVLWTEPRAAVGNGWVSAGAGVDVTVRYARSLRPDLAASDWTRDRGTRLFAR